MTPTTGSSTFRTRPESYPSFRPRFSLSRPLLCSVFTCRPRTFSQLVYARQMSTLHQSLGVGALGRSVAAPRVSTLVHPVVDRDGGDGENMEGIRTHVRRGSRLSSCSAFSDDQMGDNAVRPGRSSSAESSTAGAAAAAAAAAVAAMATAVSSADPASGCTTEESYRHRNERHDVGCGNDGVYNSAPSGRRGGSAELSPIGSISSSFFSVSSPRIANRWVDVPGGAAAALLSGSGDGLYSRRTTLMDGGGQSLRGDIGFADFNRRTSWHPRVRTTLKDEGLESVGERASRRASPVVTTVTVSEDSTLSMAPSSTSTVPTGADGVEARGNFEQPREGSSTFEEGGGRGGSVEKAPRSVGSADTVEGDDPKAAEFVVQAATNREASKLRRALVSSAISKECGKRVKGNNVHGGFRIFLHIDGTPNM